MTALVLGLSLVSCDDDYAAVEKEVMKRGNAIETPKRQDGGGNNDPDGGG